MEICSTSNEKCSAISIYIYLFIHIYTFLLLFCIPNNAFTNPSFVFYFSIVSYEEITDAELQADSDLMETLAVRSLKDDPGNENVYISYSEDYMNY